MPEKGRATRMRIVLVLVLLAGFARESQATIIDIFSTPQGPLSGGASGAVSGPGIIGGSREARDASFFQVAGGVGTFSSADGTGNVMSLAYDGTVTLDDNASFAPVDLTDGGVANLFLVGVTGYAAPFGSSLALAVSDGRTYIPRYDPDRCAGPVLDAHPDRDRRLYSN